MRKIVSIFVIISLVIYLLVEVYQFSLAWSENKPLSFDVPKEYAALFQDRYLSKFTSVITHNSKIRSPFSSFTLEKRYRFVVYRIPILKDIPLTNLIKLIKGAFDQSKNAVYHDMEHQFYNLKCKAGKQYLTSNIILTLDADSLNIIEKTDNVFSYSFVMRNMSLQYEKDGDIEIFAEFNSVDFIRTKNVPLNLLFVRKYGNLYMIIISDLNGKRYLNSKELHNFIKT